ncbi:uncharacterized protein TNCV_4712271 [Trichonephila clavipes]|nr:uncharacterized protein TNCV_4712271 [Trichonephila clavipes]
MLNIEKSIPGPTNETSQKLEAEATGLDEKIRALEALNTANDDVEDVTPAAPKVKPVMMKLFPEYNLILKDIHRTHPTATNTRIGGYIKIQAESADHHREITQFLTDKEVQYYVTEPPQIDHSNWSLKASWPPLIPKILKRTLSVKANSAFITPGLIFAQVTNGINPQQRAARGNESSTSNSDNKNKNKGFNSETLNSTNCQVGDFSFLQAIFEMKKIFDLFPNLISEMKKSSNCTDPTDKLQCLLKGVSVPQFPQ